MIRKQKGKRLASESAAEIADGKRKKFTKPEVAAAIEAAKPKVAAAIEAAKPKLIFPKIKAPNLPPRSKLASRNDKPNVQSETVGSTEKPRFKSPTNDDSKRSKNDPKGPAAHENDKKVGHQKFVKTNEPEEVEEADGSHRTAQPGCELPPSHYHPCAFPASGDVSIRTLCQTMCRVSSKEA